MVEAFKNIFSKANFLVGLAVALFTVSIWAYFNQPESEPPWPKTIQGFSFSPMREGQSPLEQKFPSEAEIEEDLKLLAGKTHAVRTYSMENTQARIPELAQKYDINVALGAWIDRRFANNWEETDKAIASAERNQNVVRVIVGNEAILRGDVTVEQIAPYLDKARAELAQPVSTAEPWHVWIKHPELAEHVDFLAVHMLPYWEGIDAETAVEYIVQQMNGLKVLFPDKPIVISEVGWPSNGRTRMSAQASPSLEAIFLRRFLARAEQEKYIYYIMEAFDQPWKGDTEGAVGAYWGVYDVQRKPKFPFTSPIVAIPEWSTLAGASVLIAAIVLSLLFIDSKTLKTRGRSFLAIVAYFSSTVAVWIIYKYVHQYLTLSSVIVGMLVLAGMIGVIFVILTEAHEWAEALWTRERRRELQLISLPDDQLPFVSIHVPAYNEPPEMLVETLNALAALNYPLFEVLVIDNNTKDPNVWQPVEEHCKKLGQRFRFFHVDPLAGFKAGELNFALAQTNPKAEVIGVIDSDYMVHPNWLHDLVPQFSKAEIAIVQAPQDYRDSKENIFKSMCYSEYSGFFFIGMRTRNERNAIIQHGTMTLVRTNVLRQVGGWAEWCITEDAELGLRIFEAGYEALYVPKSYGVGLMPDTFLDFKKQRARWAFGAVQILRRHARQLFGSQKSALTYGQRYHFIAGWLPWMADGANFIFNFAALGWAIAMIVFPKKIDPPLVEFSILPLILFAFKIGKMIYLYRTRINARALDIVGAAFAGIALSHTISSAVLQGFFIKDKPFFRTPKMADSHALLRAFLSVKSEFFMMGALQSAAFIIAQQQGLLTLDLHIWVIMLLIQSIPYTAAVLVSLLSAAPHISLKTKNT